MKKGYLVLQDGQVFEGIRFGAETDSLGELVFTTGMGGYLGALTDPAGAGQIVVQTYPLIGNTGVIREDLESDRCHVNGYVVRELCDAPSNFRCGGELEAFLKEQGVPGLQGVDTRQLTRILREQGAMNAMLCDEVPAELTVVKSYAAAGAVERVTRGEAAVYPAEGEVRFQVTLVDYGAKNSLIRWLQGRGCTVTAVSANTSAKDILAPKPDGVVLSGGPGAPAENTYQIEQVKALLGKVPLLGVGLGHQLTALAAGAEVRKLKHGHRGANQPAREAGGTRTYITTQNHGYTVDSDSLTAGRLSFVNANDGTCEGVDYPEWNAFTVQFDPASCVGPNQTYPLFDRFASLMKGGAL